MLDLAAARLALGEVGFHLGALTVGKFPVEIGVDEALDAGAAKPVVAHGASSPDLRPGNGITAADLMYPCSTAYSRKVFCSRRRPRCSRLITVPTGHSMISAISL